ncbi:MAG: hypothetical protein J7497_15990, partial [Chitinophagaceae bacterium]|nr:hypothetical protein [Chitinophagaceae bacterium]
MLTEILSGIIRKNVAPDVFEWLKEKSTSQGSSFNTAFITLPRKTGKRIIELSAEDKKNIQS